MYDNITEVNRSKGYFLDAIQAVKDKEKSMYFPQGLSLIGVNLDSDFLSESQVLADPYVAANLEDDDGITLDIRLKPEDKNDPILEVLNLVLESTSTGMFQGVSRETPEEELELKEIQKLSSLLMPKSALENTLDRMVTLFFEEDSVILQKFKMVGETYYAFSLKEEGPIDKHVYKHTLNILFKDRASSHETFFSGLVGHKLNKRVTGRIIDSIGKTNITGMFLGGTTIATKTIDTTTYAITSTDITLAKSGKISIRTADSVATIEIDDIRYSEVRVNRAGKYTLIFHMRDKARVYIYFG